MNRRQTPKFAKYLIALLVYSIVYLIVSIVMSANPVYKFVGDDFRVGDKYAFIYLIAKAPAFSDVDGAEVFRSRSCGNCFITNNKGFLPVTEYDAIVIDRNETQLEDAHMDPGKWYLLITHRRCLKMKLLSCDKEPRLISLETREKYDLCDLCQHLLVKRELHSKFKRKTK